MAKAVLNLKPLTFDAIRRRKNHRPSTIDHNRFREKLVTWYRNNARDLPWRTRPTPYRVWVSEIMLQQTRVEAVREYFTRFIRRFPTVRKLAGADEEDVLEAWSGLGYYRRARMLHAAARQIVKGSGSISSRSWGEIVPDPFAGDAPRGGQAPFPAGRLRRPENEPDPRDDLLALPGIGRYTAGAILSIAFNQPEPIVDGNVERVFARLAARNHTSKITWQLAEAHVNDGAAEGLRPSDLNQALMELGATVCTPVNPRCDACPVRAHCRAIALGAVEKIPARKPRAKPVSKRYLFAAIRDARNRVLLVRREQGDRSSLLPAGLWEFPHREWTAGKSATLADLAAELAVSINPQGGALTRTHSIMGYKLALTAQPCSLEGCCPVTQHRAWFTPAQARNAAIASATRKLLEAARS